MAFNDSALVLKSINVDLDGSNYMYWCKTMTAIIKGMGLWKIITGESKKPGEKSSSDDAELWEKRNYNLISLIRLNCARGVVMCIGNSDSAKDV